MRRLSKINAYTLSEIIVVLAITTIIVGIAFSVLSLVSKQYNAIKKAYAYRTQVLLTKQQLLVDFNSSLSVLYAENDEILIQFPNEKILYEITKEHITRDGDTIQLKVKNVLRYHQGREIDTGFVDAVKLQLGSEDVPLYLFASRENDAKTKLRANGY